MIMHSRYYCTAKAMTLIELMVSIAIMSVIAAGAFQVYSNLQQAHDRVVIKTQALDDIQRFWQLIQQDLAMAITRTIRPSTDYFGSDEQAIFPMLPHSFGGAPQVFQMSRNSSLPALQASGVPTSELRRVAYGFDDEKLIRFQWSQLDSAPDAVPLEMTLLTDVSELQFRFGYLEADLTSDTPANRQNQEQNITTTQPVVDNWQWVEEWPPEQNQSVGLSSTQVVVGSILMPKLVEVTVVTTSFGSIKRLFEVGSPDLNQGQALMSQATVTPTPPVQDPRTAGDLQQ